MDHVNRGEGNVFAWAKALWDYQVLNARRVRAAGNALVAAYRSMDSDAIAKAQREYQEVLAPLHRLVCRSPDDLHSATPEDNLPTRELQIIKAIEAMTTPVRLSDDQIRQIMEAWPKASDYEAWPAVYDQTVRQVLTLDQKIAIARHRAVTFVKEAFVELTEEQLHRVEIVATELAEDPYITPDEFSEELSNDIWKMLTREQKAAMKKLSKWKRCDTVGWRAPGMIPENPVTHEEIG